MHHTVNSLRKVTPFCLILLVLAGCHSANTPSPETATPDIHQPQQTDDLATINPVASATSTVIALSPQPTAYPTREPSPTPQPIPQPGSLTDTPLTEDGPWWFFLGTFEDYSDTSYLFAVNGDGTGLTLVTDDPVANFDIHPTDTAKEGIRIAYISELRDLSRDLTLKILTFPQGSTETITQLENLDGDEYDIDINEEPEAYQVAHTIFWTIAARQSLRWSPDGQWLAFIAALDGQNTDVYGYSTTDDTIHRLSSESLFAWQLLWSSDSRYLAYSGFTFNAVGRSGSPYNHVRGAWTISPYDDHNVDVLQGIKGARFMGWLTPETLMLHSGDFPTENLRTVNIHTGQVKYIWEGIFWDVTYDFKNQIGLLTYPSNHPMTNGAVQASGGPGNYLIKGDNIQLIDEEFSLLTWSPEINGLVGLSSSLQVMTIAPSGEASLLMDERTRWLPVFAPIGDRWIWNSTTCCDEGLWVSNPQGNEANLGEFGEDFNMDSVIWSPDGMSVLFSDDHIIYIASAPAFEVHELNSGRTVYPDRSFWPPTWVDR